MVSKKIKSSILDDIDKIQSSLSAKNDAQRSAIYLQLVSTIDMLKKHTIDKQTLLEKYFGKLHELTTDKIARSLLDSLILDFQDIGDSYAEILTFESNTKTTFTDIENIDVMLQISSKLSKLILKLQSIEDTLDEAVDRQ